MIRKPSENRNWEKFDSDDTLGPPAERTGEILALYAQGLAIRGEKDKAVTILNEALKSEKESHLEIRSMVDPRGIQGAGKPEAALNVLDDAEKVLGDTVDLRLARAELLILRAKPPTEAEFEANRKRCAKVHQVRSIPPVARTRGERGPFSVSIQRRRPQVCPGCRLSLPPCRC